MFCREYALLRLAVSTAMWEARTVFRERWLRERTATAGSGIVTAGQSAALEEEWDSTVADAFMPKRSLLPEHVFVLAHVLRRPVSGAACC